MSNAARRKGHDFERSVAKQLREIFPLAATSRYESKSLDEAEVDIANVPIYIQCKAGYEKARPKYDLILDRMKEKLQNRPKYPMWILHKMSGRRVLAVTTAEEFYNIVYTLKKHDDLVKDIQEYIVKNDNTTAIVLKEIYGGVFSE